MKDIIASSYFHYSFTSSPYLIANSFIFSSDLMDYLKHTK